MSNPWPKSLRDVCDKWDNTSEELLPVGARCRLVLEEHEDIAAEHLERNGKEVEIIAHICNGNLAVCVCYEHWARNDVGEWWVAAFNSAAFEQIDEPFWPSAKGDEMTSTARPRVRLGDEPGASSTACDDQFAPDASSRQAAINAMVMEVQPHEWRQGGAMRYQGHLITWGEYVQRRGVMTEGWYQAKDDLADAWNAGEERIDAIGTNGNDGLAYPDPQLPKQPRYRDSEGEDWIDEFARTSTPDDFRAAMRFTLGKYVRRLGKKDAIVDELAKIEDYAQRWRAWERGEQ